MHVYEHILFFLMVITVKEYDDIVQFITTHMKAKKNQYFNNVGYEPTPHDFGIIWAYLFDLRNETYSTKQVKQMFRKVMNYEVSSKEVRSFVSSLRCFQEAWSIRGVDPLMLNHDAFNGKTPSGLARKTYQNKRAKARKKERAALMKKCLS